MYTRVPLQKLTHKLDKFKLCYVDTIPETIWALPPELQEEYDKIPYEEFKNNPWLYDKFRFKDLPNPEYLKGEREYLAYFTPRTLDEQTGDDWDDTPYECNAGRPYDDFIVSSKEENGIKVATEIEEYEIIVVPFSTRSFNTFVPKDYNDGYNSHFCVDDINAGAVAWIYDFNAFEKKHGAIYAGCTPFEFKKTINYIRDYNKKQFDDYTSYED